MLAVRKNRYVILPKDFEKAYKNVVRKQVGGGAGGGWRRGSELAAGLRVVVCSTASLSDVY